MNFSKLHIILDYNQWVLKIQVLCKLEPYVECVTYSIVNVLVAFGSEPNPTETQSLELVTHPSKSANLHEIEVFVDLAVKF